MNDPIKKRSRDPTRRFFKDDIQMANKHMKRRLTSIVNREMQIKAPMTYHFTCTRMVIIKESVSEDAEKAGHSSMAVGM